MGKFFSALGINWQIFLAYLVNFSILMFILYKIGYKSVVNFVRNRTREIELGVKNAEDAKLALENARKEHEKLVAEGRKKAAEIIEESRAKGKDRGNELIAKAKTEVAEIVAKGKQTIAAEKKKMLEEAKADIIDMVIAGTQKVLGSSVDKNVDEKWLDNQLSKSK